MSDSTTYNAESFVDAFANLLGWNWLQTPVEQGAPWSDEDFAAFEAAARKLRSELSEAMALAVRVRNNLATVAEFQSKYGSL